MQMTSGWWILPAAIGGLVMWALFVVYVPWWVNAVIIAALVGTLLGLLGDD